MKFWIFLIVLIAAVAGAWTLYDRHGPGFLRITLGAEDEGASRAPAPGWMPPALPVAPAVASGGTVMDWVRDGRWERGTDAGERGAALLELAYREHFDGPGDPFLFRSRKEEAAALLAQALAELGSLRADYAGNPAAVLDLDPLIRKYEETLAKVKPR